MTPPAIPSPVVWCVGGVDSSGGAGITRDITTLTSLNIHACAITTLLSAQSHTSLLRSEGTTSNVFNTQWQVLENDLPPNAIKIGALANDEQAHTICSNIQRLSSPRPFIAWDPVFITSSGGHLSHLGRLTYTAIKQLLRTVDVVTPNIEELAALSRLPITDQSSLVAAAQQLISLGAKAVLVKGGHAHWQDDMVDVLLTSEQIVYFTLSTHNTVLLRGTGCMLASACCGFVAKGYSLIDALTLAIAYVREARASALRSTGDYFVAGINGFPSNPDAFPRLTICANTQINGHVAPNINDDVSFLPLLNPNLGLYPVVDSVAWIKVLLPTGIKVIQLRIKEGSPQEIREQIANAVQLTKHSQCQLFINDHWALAIELGAYGVHLGQEDIETADLDAIRKAGLRLGISTHGYAEIQRVKQLNPSYIALGHIFPTTTKVMPSKPQGLQRLANYVPLCGDIPTVAIGGITQSRIKPVKATGVQGVAVVTAITEASDPLHACNALIREVEHA